MTMVGKVKGAYMLMAAASFWFAASTVLAQVTLTKDAFKCETATGKALTKFVGAKGKCIQKCLATAQKAVPPGPFAQCFAPAYSDPATHACIFDNLKGAVAKAGAAIVKACTAQPDSCPQCYTPNTKCTDATGTNPFLASSGATLDVFAQELACMESGIGGAMPAPDKAQVKCEAGLSKALGKFAAAKSKCYAKCGTNAFNGKITQSACTPPATDPTTQTCVMTATNKATLSINKVCFGPAPIETPPCYDGTALRQNTTAGWLTLVENSLDTSIPTVACAP